MAALLLVLHISVSAETGAMPEAPVIHEDRGSMAWPMLPHESLRDLAQLFYPKQTGMQHLFVQRALRLNAKEYPDLTADDQFAALTPLRVPTLKSLAHARPIHKKPAAQNLKMSYGIQSLQSKAMSGLLEQYQYLLSRNGLLKEEIAKLNQQLTQLQQKLQDLKQLFDNTLRRASQPERGKSAEVTKVDATPSINTQIVPAASPAPAMVWQSYLRTPWMLVLFGLTLLVLTGFWLLKKSRRMLQEVPLAQANGVEAGNLVSDSAWRDGGLPDLDRDTLQYTGVQVKEIDHNADAQGVLEEARLLASVSRYEEAIAHLKAHIDTNPKLSIQPWLYLLEIFKQRGMKEDFEHYAESIHQTFNIITPLWEPHEVALVVPETLEDFPHIMEKLCGDWPDDDVRRYLQNLINDNRNGERGGFGQSVLDEILTLIGVLDVRKDLASV